MTESEDNIFESIKNEEKLINFLQTWSYAKEDIFRYDFGSIAHYLGACLDNLKEYAVPGQLQDTGNYLEAEQVEFLSTLAELA